MKKKSIIKAILIGDSKYYYQHWQNDFDESIHKEYIYSKLQINYWC